MAGLKSIPTTSASGRIILNVPPGPDAGIENSAGEILEHHGTNMTISAILERKVQQVVKRGYSLVSLQQIRHDQPSGSGADNRGAAASNAQGRTRNEEYGGR